MILTSNRVEAGSIKIPGHIGNNSYEQFVIMIVKSDPIYSTQHRKLKSLRISYLDGNYESVIYVRCT